MRIIDRIEGDSAVVEITEEFVTVPLSSLPENAKEGDVLVCEGGVYRVDCEATKKRRAAIKARLNRLKKKTEQKHG